MESQRVIDALEGFDFWQLHEQLSQGPADPGTATNVVRWTERLRNEFLTTIRSVEDGEDVYISAVANYIELKARWIAINNQINYEMIKQGAPNAESQFQGFAVYSLLASIEPLIEENDVESLTAFLAEPVTPPAFEPAAAPAPEPEPAPAPADEAPAAEAAAA
ncbi:MAG: hypothetical protein AAF297_03515 [Planctomycetota bacterium]